MAVQVETASGRSGSRAHWRDWVPAIGVASGFLGVIVSVLAVGAAVLGAVDRVQVETRELRAGQADIRERLTRVEARLEVLAGEWPARREDPPDR